MKPLSLVQTRMLSELKVPAELSLGRIRMSAGQLLDLAERTLIEIPLSDGQRVTIIVGGEPVASGRLVYDGSRVFLEIEKTGAQLEETEPMESTIYRDSTIEGAEDFGEREEEREAIPLGGIGDTEE